MKILLINNYHHIKGGADRVYINTINLLKEHGHDVICFSSANNENFNSQYLKYFVPIENSRTLSFYGQIRNSFNYLYNTSAAKQLELLIQDTLPEIAHINLFYGGLSSSLLRVLRKNKIPIVITVHDYRLLCPANAYLNSSNRICEKCNDKFYFHCTLDRCLEGKFFYSLILTLEAYIRKYFIKPLKFIDHFVFVSKFSQSKHIAVYNEYKNKSSHIYNFSPIIPDNVSFLLKSNYFLYFGRLSSEKGIITLLNAAKKTRIQLKIVGSGPLRQEVEEFCHNNSNVQYLGYQNGDALNNTIKNSSYVVVPSEWYENNPMTVIEAFSFGIPVIGARIGGIPEIVEDDKNGFLFNSRDENDLSMVFNRAAAISSEDYLRMSNYSRTFAINHFSKESHYNQLISLYKKLVNNDK